MEFPFRIRGVVLPETITVWNRKTIAELPPATKHKLIPPLTEIVDKMGLASARAQKLGAPITSLNKLQYADPPQNLYIICSDTTVDGILKVGRKKLFINGEFGQIHEITPLCVLDFYVHESKQRSGVGSRLFNYMLEAEKVTPDKLAYDRPSEKFLAFLHKYFGLRSYTPQSNNYVVFRDYFLNNSKSSSRSSANSESQHQQHQPLQQHQPQQQQPQRPPATIKERPLTGSTSRQHRPGKKYEPQKASATGFGALPSAAASTASSSATLPSPRSLAPLSAAVSLPPSEPGVVAPSRPAPLPDKLPSGPSSAASTPRRSGASSLAQPAAPSAALRNTSLPNGAAPGLGARQTSVKWSDTSPVRVGTQQSQATVSSHPSLFGRYAHSPNLKGGGMSANPLIGFSNSFL